MKNIINLLCLLAITVHSSAQSFILDGSVQGCEDKMVYLKDHQTMDVLDSTMCKNGKFRFSKYLEEPNLIRLTMEGKIAFSQFYIENMPMQYTLNSDTLWRYELSETPLNKIINESERSVINPLRMELIRYSNLMNELNPRTSDSTRYKELMLQSEALGKLADIYTNNLITDNPNNFISIAILENHYSTFGIQKTVDFIKKLPDTLRNTPTAIKLTEKLNKSLAIKSGISAPAFKLFDSEGKEWQLADEKNKYVFLNFWASWCGPCRAEHPDLIRIYEDYKDNILFVSVSIDEEKQDWMNAVKKDKMKWLQLLDDQNQSTKDKYGVFAVPSSFLIDKEGLIIDAAPPSPSDPKLRELFDELLKK